MTDGIGLQVNPPSPNDPREPPECPDWLIEELKQNPVFVQEAIANWEGKEIALAWISGLTLNLPLTINTAVEAWIAHWWISGDYDADHISRMWKRLEKL